MMTADHMGIGGYFGLEFRPTPKYHNGVYLNSGRNALRYIIRAYGIHDIYVPRYTCPVVWDALIDEGCEIKFYNINVKTFLPDCSFPKSSYIVYNNYFGVNGLNVRKMALLYPNLIVDNAQALFASPNGVASFYSPRKFCGLPDGGIACCEKRINVSGDRDSSIERMEHILGRTDSNSASTYYESFKKDDATLDHLPVKKMSRLCETLLNNIDFNYIKKRRLLNFNYLHKTLKSPLVRFMDENDVPMIYPFYTKCKSLRKNLIENRIYVATYWPNMESEYCNNIIALPLDQRYSSDEMRRILDIIRVV